MPLVPRPFPAALPHGPLSEILPGIFFVTGGLRLPIGLPVRFSRAMTVVREGERLVLVNSVRLSDEGLAGLDALGKVTDVIRLAGNHGMDDPFYRDRYGAKVWVVKGQRYTAGFDTKSAQVYFEPDVEMDETTALPVAGARLLVIDSSPPEANLLLERHGGTLISGDCLQNWKSTDEHFNWLGKGMMRMMGFIKPANLGPGWLKQCKPPHGQIKALLERSFTNVLPSHGTPVLGGARDAFRPVIERL